MVKGLSIFAQKNADFSKIIAAWELIGIFFSKAIMVSYHCTKFHVSSIPLSRDVGRVLK